MSARPSLSRVLAAALAFLAAAPVLVAHAAPKAVPPGSAPANAAAPRPVPAANFNILILAVDPSAADLAPPQPAAPRSPGQTVPQQEPNGRVAPPSIRPASVWPFGVWPLGAVRTLVSAKKTKPDPDDDKFRLEPEPPPALYYPKGKAPIQPAPGEAPPVQAPPAAQPVNPETPPAFVPPFTATNPDAPTFSLSQSAAAPLRRALTNAGYTDVLDTVLDGPSVLRAVGSRRLSPRVLLQLRRAVAQISAALAVAPAPEPATAPAQAPELLAPPASAPLDAPLSEELLARAARAAARVGQALGYRAVVVLSVVPGRANALDYTLLVTDALRENTDPVAFDGTGTANSALSVAAATGASLVAARLVSWPVMTPAQTGQAALDYFKAAQVRAAANDSDGAQDLLNQALALNPRLFEADKLLGDLLQSSDPAGAAQAYRRAVEGDIADGETWGKIAVSQTLGDNPDWPRAVQAGERALKLGYDSAALRTALAVAQLARARLYNDADPPRYEKAEACEVAAREHLDRAFALEPANPAVIRLMAEQLVNARHFREAVQLLDRLAVQYPTDAALQTQYALALMGVEGRDEDAFAAWARAWKLAGAAEGAPVDDQTYARLAEGFDRRVDNIGQSAARLSLSAANGALGREQALLQLTRLQEDMTTSANAIKSLQPPRGSSAAIAQETRAFAADLLNQALGLHRKYLETNQLAFQNRALEAQRQAIANLRLARDAN